MSGRSHAKWYRLFLFTSLSLLPFLGEAVAIMFPSTFTLGIMHLRIIADSFLPCHSQSYFLSAAVNFLDKSCMVLPEFD